MKKSLASIGQLAILLAALGCGEEEAATPQETEEMRQTQIQRAERMYEETNQNK